MTLTNSKERISIEEIEKVYPDTWVGPKDIIWKNGANIESAAVYATGTKDEMYNLQIFENKVEYVIYTNLKKFDNFIPSIWEVEV